ncbi:hypothetical protein PAEPH01_1266 [Pancytospora epiphaga]|nr:hypothetical protein PAEPH01_1266 [Pancytospora epiphaga]
MEFSKRNISPASTVEFTEGNRSATTSFKSFNLYDTNIFATFFYSDIEKVWLVVVKSGKVIVNGNEISSSVILCNMSVIKFDTVEVRFKNMKDDIGLSQHLVERLLVANDGKITQEKILEFAGENVDNGLILGCLRKNKLFTECGGIWRIDYRNYIDFLEGREDPLYNAVLHEIGSKSMSVGHARTFNIKVIWDNDYFSGGYTCQDTCGAAGAAIEQSKGVPNWPHSAHPSSLWNMRCDVMSDGQHKLFSPVSSMSQARSSDCQVDAECFFDRSNTSACDSSMTLNDRHESINGAGKTFNKIKKNSVRGSSATEIIRGDVRLTNHNYNDFTGQQKQSNSPHISNNFNIAEVEIKESKANNVFNKFGIKNNHGYRKCYSVADGANYLEGYRVCNENGFDSTGKCTKDYFGKLKETIGNDNKTNEGIYDFKMPSNGGYQPSTPLSQVVHETEPSRDEPLNSLKKEAGVFNYSKMDFVENYLADFTSNESNSVFEGVSSGADKTKAAYPFVFMLGSRQYVPRKRKSILLPVKRYKFHFVPEFSPKIHDLPNFSSGVVVTSEYYSDGETPSDDFEANSRDRCHSKTEARSFTGRDHDYDMVTLVNTKRKLRRKYIL